MAAHFHLCEQCGKQYVCSASLEPNHDGWPDPVCVTRKEADQRYRLCVDCAEVAPSSYEANAYDALRARDEQQKHVHANSYLGRQIAKRVRVEED